jgi:mono/diheme cytochrome c family protein
VRAAPSIAALVAATALSAVFARPAASQDAPNYLPLFDQYCVACHNTDERKGGLAFDEFDVTDATTNAPRLELMVRKLRAGAMPPVGEPRPSLEQYEGLASWLEASLDAAAAGHIDPGRPALYRLNRVEYANAIRDLLALDIDVEALLPPDSSSYGFDNIADVLGVSPTLLEGYLAAADRVSAFAVGDPEIAAEEARYDAGGMRTSQDEHVEGLPLGTRGGIRIEHVFPLDGVYEIDTAFLGNTVDALRGLQHEHDFEIAIDGERVKLVTIGGMADFANMMLSWEENRHAIEDRVKLRLPVTAGPHVVTATFVMKTDALEVSQLQPFEISHYDPVFAGGVPMVESVTIRGPYAGLAPAGSTPSRDVIFSCRPASEREEAACAEEILARLARRAYRRPVERSDVASLMTFFDAGRAEKGAFDGGVQYALRRLLASPEFLFRIERDPANIAPGEAFALSDVELASRLSFFLWSSIPDDELLSVAERGDLRDPDVLRAQVERMLADPRSHALVENFAGQWLQLRNLERVEPDLVAFPDFDESLRDGFRRETTLFVASVFEEDRSILDLLHADYTFLNERLARHYGVPGVYGSDFRRVQIDQDARRGLLGQGAILTVTSYPHRTSPVIRGKWVLENLLAAPIPAPPDNVPALAENAEDSLDHETLRDRLARHRDDPACSVCHNVMDPIGLSMERFDGIGAWRDKDETGAPVDSSGRLASGEVVDGPVELREAILRRPEQFVSAFTEKLLTYAIGRGVEHYDMPTVRRTVADAAADDYRFSSIVFGIVSSPPFQMKRAGEKPPQEASLPGESRPAL